MPVRYEWRGEVDSGAVEALHAEAFGHEPVDHDWAAQLRDHSLGWVCAFDDDDGGDGGALVGFVNVAWDGALHAFLIDTAVAERARRRGIGRELVRVAEERAAAAGCEWLHVDFDDHLRPFYVDACGFTPTDAGLVALR
ncbi:MAG TPA: GNAT family N-acetyltransferase [Acidimicrobiales bacterium]|jgi:ribosomal protein S18 acetylase RimI-like enzyme